MFHYLNFSEIARELSLNRLLIANYFTILEDLLLGIRINPFTHRAKRKIIAHQKFYFFDVGVYKTLRPVGPLDISAEIDGAGLETLFLQSIRAINDYFAFIFGEAPQVQKLILLCMGQMDFMHLK